MDDTPPPLEHLLPVVFAAYRARDYQQTAQLAETLTRHYPQSVDAWMLLTTALGRMGSADEEKAIAMALEHIPADHPTRMIFETDRANALGRIGLMNDAVALLRRIEDDPRIDARQRDTIGAVYAQAGLFNDALKHAEAAVAAAPGHAPAIYNYATALRYLGRLDESEAAFERLLAIAPSHSLAHTSLAALRKWTPQKNHVARLRAAVAAVPAEDQHAKARLHYALFRELSDIKAPAAEAWRELEAGAAICRELFPFPLAERTAYVEAAVKVFDRAKFATPLPHKPAPPRPIFIVGLPRSGTTLTERILAAHSQVTAMGETNGFPVAMRRALKLLRRDGMTPESVARSLQLDWSEVARNYLQEVSFLARDAKVVTEKLPHNYELAGQIALAFPNAAIVHVRRGPMDSMLGAFKIMFGDNAYPWSYRLADMAANYRLYRKLMAHWKQALGDRLHVVTLEHLIENQEPDIRRLLEFCRLPFEQACLSPHESEGGVSTASSSQVRKPINREGVDAWRAYAAQMEPLRAELERDGFVDKNGDPIWD